MTSYFSLYRICIMLPVPLMQPFPQPIICTKLSAVPTETNARFDISHAVFVVRRNNLTR